jgi:hypothetical protein
MPKPTPKPVFEKLEQVRAQLTGAVERTPNRFTTSEYAAATNTKGSAAKLRLNALLQAGRVRRIVMRVQKANGTIQPMAAWEYIDEESSNAGGDESSRA